MLSRTRLAAVAFNESDAFNDGSANYRVYYQDSGLLLKESCFEESKGWYVRENCIVATDAKKYTPLAAASWANGNEIRIYYMNNKSKVLERKWNREGSEDNGVWQAGRDPGCTAPDPQTQLAVACTEDSDGSVKLRLFYQSAGRELRQATWSPHTLEWEDAALVSENGGKFTPVRGSSLAVSAGTETQVFYRAGSRKLETIKEQGGKWSNKRLSTLGMSIGERTPIAIAPPLELDEPETDNKLAIFFTDSRGKLLHKLFDTDKEDLVDDKVKNEEDESDSDGGEVEAGGAITIASSSEENASVFYQSSPTKISEYDIKGRFEVFLGIPTSLGGDPRAYVTLTGAVRALGLQESLMLGLVDRRKIDMMDGATKQKFTQRLTMDMIGLFNRSGTQVFNRDDVRKCVENLSSDFGLGIFWLGTSSTTVWKDRTQVQWDNIWRNTSLPLQERVTAGKEATVLGNASLGKFDLEAYNTVLYMETLDKLCRYLDIGK